MILGKSVAGKMRFRQQADAGNTSSARKLVPGGIGYGMERKGPCQLIEERAQFCKIRQCRRVTPVCFDDPFAPTHWLLLGASALRTEFRRTRNRLSAVEAEFCRGFGPRGCGGYRSAGGWNSGCSAGRRFHSIHHALRDG